MLLPHEGRGLRSPGPLARPVVIAGIGALGITLVTIAVLMWLGVLWHGMPSKYFRERKVGTYYSGLLLLAAGAIAHRVRGRAGAPDARRFWTVTAAGFVYLALDDVVAIHEEVDRWVHRLLRWDARHWLTDHLDDAIVGLYGVIAVLWAAWHRRALLALRWTTLLLALAFGGFAVMIVLDVVGRSPTLEEATKLLAETVIVIAMLAAYHDPVLRGDASSARGRTGVASAGQLHDLEDRL